MADTILLEFKNFVKVYHKPNSTIFTPSTQTVQMLELFPGHLVFGNLYTWSNFHYWRLKFKMYILFLNVGIFLILTPHKH